MLVTRVYVLRTDVHIGMSEVHELVPFSQSVWYKMWYILVLESTISADSANSQIAFRA